MRVLKILPISDYQKVHYKAGELQVSTQNLKTHNYKKHPSTLSCGLQVYMLQVLHFFRI